MIKRLLNLTKKFSILLVVSCSSIGQEEAPSVTISFVGDILLDRGVKKNITRNGEIEFYKHVKDRITSTDFLIGNMECPITNISSPVTKKFCFKCDPRFLSILRDVGFTHLNMANNHTMDQGRDGILDTYRNISKANMKTIGFGSTHSNACKPTLINKNNINVALFSSVVFPIENWMFMDNQTSICQTSPSDLSSEILLYKKKFPNHFIVVQLHWGVEHTIKPKAYQKKYAHELINAGADAIIGHHSHTIQSFETYNNKPIFYGIGNCIFDQKNEINKYGLQVFLTFQKSNFSVSVDTIHTDYSSY
jgi:poly-gamma-glutamate capsule biosynthesis protein CapA/YwtB (metallophosphatase superfamily)